jgi:hypothetical protein
MTMLLLWEVLYWVGRGLSQRKIKRSASFEEARSWA